MQSAIYNDSIFINCPFDSEYTPTLYAVIFSVYRCGFFPKSALSEDNALENRLGKIENIIESCRYGIHDISRTKLNDNNLPRFNMPFELGIFFGAKRFGNRDQKNKNALVFDKDSYRYQEFISDLNGVDIKAHNEDPYEAIRKIRNWLHTASRRTTIPGYTRIVTDYQNFKAQLPGIVNNLDLDTDDIPFNDLCLIIEEYLKTL